MATLATAKTLTVKITEDITLNGVQQGSTTTNTVSSVAEIYKRIMTKKSKRKCGGRFWYVI